MSSSCGEVKGWCAAFQRLLGLVPLEHGEVGDPEEAVVACLVEGAVLGGVLLAEGEAKLSGGGVDGRCAG